MDGCVTNSTDLLDLELSYRELAEVLPSMIAVSRPDGWLVYINEHWRAYTGLTLDELNADRAQIFHPDDAARVIAANAAARERGEPLEIDYRVRRHDGAYRWHTWRCVPFRDAAGGITHWAGATIDIDDRKRSEQRLRESEMRWLSLAETMPANVTLADPAGKMQYINQRWRDYMGIDEMQEATSEWPLRMHPEDRDRLAGDFLKAVSANRPFEGESRVRGADGAYRWFLGRTAPVFSDEGEVIWWIGVSVDISERRAHEEQVHARELEYRSLADATPAIVCRATADGTLDYFNSQWYEYTGVDLGGAADTRSVFHPDEADFVAGQWWDAIRTGEPYDIEYRVRRHDGVYRWHFGRVVPIRDAAGAIVNWISSSVDIDERKRAEDGQRVLNEIGSALSRSLNYDATIEAIVHASAPRFADICAVYMKDEAGAISRIATSHSDPTRAALSQHELNAGGRLSAAVFNKGAVQFWEQIPDDVLRDSATSDEHLAVLRAVGFRSGIVVPVVARGSIIGAMSFSTAESSRTYDWNDVELAVEIGRRAGLAIDNARLYRDAQVTLAELRRANDAKDEFLGLVSHELKTPITTILGNAKVLHDKRDRISEGDQDLALADIAHEAERLHSIIENLLVLARLERGQQIEMEPLLIERFVERIVREHMRTIPARKITITSDAANAPALAEAGYSEQVLRNLLSNAEKYSPRDQPIDVAITASNSTIKISVRDRGEGLDAEEAERIFEPFYRSPRVVDRAQGVGIGLSVCRRLVEAQSGRIAAGPAAGGGTEFWFTLPLGEDHAGVE
jgi:PAS domain S-box-containing protein